MTTRGFTDDHVPTPANGRVPGVRRAGAGAEHTALRPTGAQVTTAVELAVERVDPVTGVRHRLVLVDDGFTGSPRRVRVQQDFAEQDRLLVAHPEWRDPEVVDGRLLLHNDVSRWFYASSAMREWRSALVPRASALYPVQRPLEERLPSGAVIDDIARDIFTDCFDSIGIRTRAAVLTDVVVASATAALHPARPVWVSLACGAAVPVLDALTALDRAGVAQPRLRLVDLDPGALEFARRLALAHGLVEGDDFQLLRRDLVSSIVARATLVDELGQGSTAIVDAVGIFEYFRDAACVRLLRNSFRLLRPGGVVIIGNMLADRPEFQLNQRGIGWPRVHPRSPDDLLDLVHRAGLPLDRTTITVPQDGVYAVLDVRR